MSECPEDGEKGFINEDGAEEYSKVEKRSLHWDFTIGCRQRTAIATLICISTLSYPSYTPSAWYTPSSLSVLTHSFLFSDWVCLWSYVLGDGKISFSS